MKFLIPFLIFSLPLLLYLKTLPPTYIPVDSSEFALCMHFLGICHPPGFPLYILIGHIFTTIFPFGSLIFKANLLSAIYGSATILFIYLILKKLGVKEVIAISIPMLLAVSSSFWEYSISSDVFTFATFLLSLSFWLLFSKRTWLSFFILGLSSSHFYITALLTPLFVWYYWGTKPSAENLIKSAAIFSLGFFPQVLIYFRMLQHPEINWGHVQNFGQFIDFLRRLEFGGFFIIQTPISTFSLLKFTSHFILFLITSFLEFAFLPLIIFFPFKQKVSRQFLFLIFSFLLIFFIQILTISTVDPNSETFQINKFYILSFFLMTLLIGVSLDKIFKDYKQSFNKNYRLNFKFLYILALLPIFYSLINLSSHDQSLNYFTQNLVLDALGELPANSLAITDNHWFYYGVTYEQKINHKFENITLLYYPNTTNHDTSKYYPEYFKNPPDQEFISKLDKRFNLGPGEKIILDGVSRNLDRDIYFIQGSHEEIALYFLKKYFVPYGLWWKFNVNPKNETALKIFENLRNKNFKKQNFWENQEQQATLIYALSYHTQALQLAKLGQYDKALEFFQKSFEIDETNLNIPQEIKTIQETKSLESMYEELLSDKETQSLLQLASLYYTIGNYRKSVSVYQKLIELEPDNKDFKSALEALKKTQED